MVNKKSHTIKENIENNICVQILVFLFLALLWTLAGCVYDHNIHHKMHLGRKNARKMSFSHKNKSNPSYNPFLADKMTISALEEIDP